MDFKATNLFERNYKWLAAIFVGAFTAYAIYYYVGLDDKSDTFVIALGYALLLFLAGIFLNYMNSVNESKIDERIEIYRNLSKASSFLEDDNDKEYLERVRMRIIMFQVSTGRTEDMENPNIRPMISQRGIKFNASELVIEEEFENAYHALLSKLRLVVQTYIKENDIQINSRNISLNSISLFSPDIWCRENLCDYNKYGRKMIAYLYKELEKIREEIEALEGIGQKVMRLYDQYQCRANKNIKQIERIYGRKLNYKMLQKSELEENFRFVLERIYEVEDRLSESIDEHDDKMENYVSEINEVLQATNDIRIQIIELQDTIESCLKS